MSKHGHKRQSEQHVHVNKYANCSRAESVAARLNAESRRAKSHESYPSHLMRDETIRTDSSYNEDKLDYLGGGRANPPKSQSSQGRSLIGRIITSVEEI